MKNTMIVLFALLMFVFVSDGRVNAADFDLSIWGGYNDNITNTNVSPEGAAFISPSAALMFGDGGPYLGLNVGAETYFDSNTSTDINAGIGIGYADALFESPLSMDVSYWFSGVASTAVSDLISFSKGKSGSSSSSTDGLSESSLTHKVNGSLSYDFEYIDLGVGIIYEKTGYSDTDRNDGLTDYYGKLTFIPSDFASVAFSVGNADNSSDDSSYSYSGMYYQIGASLNLSDDFTVSGSFSSAKQGFEGTDDAHRNGIIGAEYFFSESSSIAFEYVATKHTSTGSDYAYDSSSIAAGLNFGF